MSPLPEWIQEWGEKGCECGWTHRSHKVYEALSIAWLALEQIEEFEPEAVYDLFQRVVVENAMRRIEKVGE